MPDSLASGGADHGAADPLLAQALTAGDVVAIREALMAARVLVPIVAMPVDASAPESDGAQMAVPRLIGSDGRQALPVFTSQDSLRAWRPDARPVPMPGEQAIVAAIGEGYDVVVLDVAGPITHAIDLASAKPAPETAR
jgi:SseB protein N-terminal domain